MAGTPAWWRSKWRSAGVTIPYKSCSGARELPWALPAGMRRGRSNGERRPSSLRGAPGTLVGSGGTIVCGACAGTWACPTRHSACAPTALAALARRARREIDTSAIVSLPVRGMSPKLSRASYFMAMLCLLLGFLVSAVASGGGGTPPARSCEACHREIVATFLETAHFRTSAEASGRSIKGHFAAGRNVLRTGSQGIYFKMERRDNAFYETAVDSARGWSRTERIDLVFGSGRRGQSYVYWRGGLLFELPVSYLVGIERWINSPGYVDGQIDFG